MQSNQIPTLVPLAFAAGGAFNTIPEASQIGTNPGGASLVDGFPPLTRTPIAAGGIPPSGLDMNGVLNLITQSIRWAHGGGRYAYNATFAADVNVGGYPSGSILMSADGQGSWLSVADNNTDNPDTGPGTKWVPSQAYGFSSVGGLTNANVTLTPAQAMKMRINLFGTLTGNVQIIFPTWTREWTVVNNTTGAFTVTAKTASGSGIVLPAGPSRIVGDGTNIVQPAENIAPATQSSQALTAGQVGAIGGQGSLPINTSGKVNGVNSPNLLFNGSGEFGNAGWNGTTVVSGLGGAGEGTFLKMGSAQAGSFSIYTNQIVALAGQQFNLSGLVATPGVSSGTLYLQIVFVNSSGSAITAPAVQIANGSSAWTTYTVSAISPSGTASMYVQFFGDNNFNASANGLFWRRLKLEGGSSPSLYSQEASIAALAVMHGMAQFTSSGTFTVPTGVTTVYVSGCAGGGGGGAGAGNNNGQSSLVGGGGGGGGGAGQSVLKQSFSVTSGATITVTIGAAGTAGAGGVVGAGGAGGAGGNTTLTGGASLTLTGGTGGSGGAAVVSNAIGQGGGGGSGGAGFPNGSAGGDGNYAGLGGAGASSPFGGGGGSGRAATNTSAYQVGSAAGGYGAGGGGGGAGYGQASTAVTGGAGAVGTAGLIVFEW